MFQLQIYLPNFHVNFQLQISTLIFNSNFKLPYQISTSNSQFQTCNFKFPLQIQSGDLTKTKYLLNELFSNPAGSNLLSNKPTVNTDQQSQEKDEGETLKHFAALFLSLGPVSSPVRKLIIHLLLDHLGLNISVLLIQASSSYN